MVLCGRPPLTLLPASLVVPRRPSQQNSLVPRGRPSLTAQPASWFVPRGRPSRNEGASFSGSIAGSTTIMPYRKAINFDRFLWSTSLPKTLPTTNTGNYYQSTLHNRSNSTDIVHFAAFLCTARHHVHVYWHNTQWDIPRVKWHKPPSNSHVLL